MLALGSLVALQACGDRAATERREDFAVTGIDLSHHQSAVDWPAIAANDLDFAYIKATEGGDYLDTRFRQNWMEARFAGLARGAYHFFRPNVDATAQAHHFTKTVVLLPGDLPPVLDVETIDAASRDELIRGVRAWLYEVEVHYGVRPILYTNLGFYYRHLTGHFDDYTFWIARYSDREPSIAPSAHLAFWQYGERGQVAGITGPVDLNVFFGSQAQFDSLRIPQASPYIFDTALTGPEIVLVD